MNRKLLLISDLAGYGKVGMSAMFPILAKAGINTFNLPTALISNTFAYGQFKVLDTTEYMEQTLSTWERLNFSFDIICIGYITSTKQANLVLDYVQSQKKNGAFIFLDPIMGDDGELFSGLSQQTVENMKRLCAVSDIIIPNFTEAAFLANMNPQSKNLDGKDSQNLLHTLSDLGAKSIIITSARVNSRIVVLGYDGHSNRQFALPVNYIPVNIPGAGDIFTALVISRIFTGADLENAVEFAMRNIEILIAQNTTIKDINQGIPLEKSLELLDFEK